MCGSDSQTFPNLVISSRLPSELHEGQNTCISYITWNLETYVYKIPFNIVKTWYKNLTYIYGQILEYFGIMDTREIVKMIMLYSPSKYLDAIFTNNYVGSLQGK